MKVKDSDKVLSIFQNTNRVQPAIIHKSPFEIKFLADAHKHSHNRSTHFSAENVKNKASVYGQTLADVEDLNKVYTSVRKKLNMEIPKSDAKPQNLRRKAIQEGESNIDKDYMRMSKIKGNKSYMEIFGASNLGHPKDIDIIELSKQKLKDEKEKKRVKRESQNFDPPSPRGRNLNQPFIGFHATRADQHTKFRKETNLRKYLKRSEVNIRQTKASSFVVEYSGINSTDASFDARLDESRFLPDSSLVDMSFNRSHFLSLVDGCPIKPYTKLMSLKEKVNEQIELLRAKQEGQFRLKSDLKIFTQKLNVISNRKSSPRHRSVFITDYQGDSARRHRHTIRQTTKKPIIIDRSLMSRKSLAYKNSDLNLEVGMSGSDSDESARGVSRNSSHVSLVLQPIGSFSRTISNPGKRAEQQIEDFHVQIYSRDDSITQSPDGTPHRDQQSKKLDESYTKNLRFSFLPENETQFKKQESIKLDEVQKREEEKKVNRRKTILSKLLNNSFQSNVNSCRPLTQQNSRKVPFKGPSPQPKKVASVLSVPPLKRKRSTDSSDKIPINTKQAKRLSALEEEKNDEKVIIACNEFLEKKRILNESFENALRILDRDRPRSNKIRFDNYNHDRIEKHNIYPHNIRRFAERARRQKHNSLKGFIDWYYELLDIVLKYELSFDLKNLHPCYFVCDTLKDVLEDGEEIQMRHFSYIIKNLLDYPSLSRTAKILLENIRNKLNISIDELAPQYKGLVVD